MKTKLQEQLELLMTKQAIEAPKAEGKPETAPSVPSAPTENTQPDAKKEQVTGFLSPDMAKLLSTQLGNEMFSAYEYYAIAGWFKNQGLDGFMKWAKGQGDGELGHFSIVYEFLLESGQEFNMPELGAPVSKFGGVKDAVAAVLALEKAVTNDWRKIHAQAMDDKDGASLGLSTQLLREQLEEEDQAFTLLQRVNLASGGDGILTIDAQLMCGK
jgi:ferritin